MKRIAFIELDTHAEIAANFFEIMRDSSHFNVDFFFSEKILMTLNIVEKQHVIKSTPENLLTKLARYSYDLVVIGTVHRNFNLYLEIVHRFKTAVICHNLNFCKQSKFQLLSLVFKDDFKYRLKLLFKESLLKSPEVLRKAAALLVLDQSLATEKFQVLPVFYTKFSGRKIEQDFLTVVIPGEVSQKRRNYDEVFETILKLKTPKKIAFIFLGKAQENQLLNLQNLQKEVPENIEIKFFSEKIPQNVFEKIMQTADILWCPVQLETTFFSQREIYGKTKMSGNMGDAIKFGKNAIFPRRFKGEKPFIFYQEDDFEKQIFNLKERSTFNFQSHFNLNEVRKNLENKLQSLL